LKLAGYEVVYVVVMNDLQRISQDRLDSGSAYVDVEKRVAVAVGKQSAIVILGYPPTVTQNLSIA